MRKDGLISTVEAVGKCGPAQTNGLISNVEAMENANPRKQWFIFDVEAVTKSNGANGSIFNVEATGSNANRCEEMVWFSNVEALGKCKPAQENGLIFNEEATAESNGGNGVFQRRSNGENANPCEKMV